MPVDVYTDATTLKLFYHEDGVAEIRLLNYIPFEAYGGTSSWFQEFHTDRKTRVDLVEVFKKEFNEALRIASSPSAIKGVKITCTGRRPSRRS
jgi:hypothetical protein